MSRPMDIAPKDRGSKPPPEPDRKAAGDPTIAVFLSLYLLLLAFFILLTAMSEFETDRRVRVIDGLVNTFTAIPSTVGAVSADPVNVLGGNPFIEQANRIVAAALPAARPRAVVPGRLLEVPLHVEELFLSGTSTLRPGRGAFLDEIITALSRRVDGMRYEVEFIVGSEYLDAGSAAVEPAVEPPEVTRAGAFAREMTARGAPLGTVLVGVAPGRPIDVRLVFRVVDDGEPGLDFRTR